MLLPVAQMLSAREGPVPLSDELRRAPIMLGVQFMTGYRSNYVHRGVEVGEEVAEGQVASSIALSNDWALAGEFDFLHAFQGKDFSQTTFYGELQYYLGDELTVGPSIGSQFYGGKTVFRNAWEPGFALRWNPVPDWSFWATGLYDTGQKGEYGTVAVSWQPLIAKSVAWENTVAVGISSDYVGASGISDVMVRTGLNIRLGKNFRLQPFVGVTFGVGDRDGHKVTGGFWFTLVY